MYNGDLEELIRYYGKLRPWIRRAVRGILPEHSRKEEREKQKEKKRKDEKFNIHVIWSPEYKYNF